METRQQVKVSIGIPTYNRADGYFKETLESALAQTYPDIEIIVADNGSTDNTGELVASYEDPRIKYYRQEKNIDPNDNFNFCLQQAKGDYFLLLHDDDLIDPDFVEACMKEARGRIDLGVIQSGTRLIDHKGRVLHESPIRLKADTVYGYIKGWFEHKIALYLCSTLYNTKLLKKNGGFRSPHNLFQDVVATVKLVAAGGRAACKDVKASYRRHGSNRGDSVKVMHWCQDCAYLLELMCRLEPEHALEIQKMGNIYFSRKCYRKAVGIRNPVRRFVTYYRIFRFFESSCSPRQTIRANDWKAMKGLLGLN